MTNTGAALPTAHEYLTKTASLYGGEIGESDETGRVDVLFPDLRSAASFAGVAMASGKWTTPLATHVEILTFARDFSTPVSLRVTLSADFKWLT